MISDLSEVDNPISSEEPSDTPPMEGGHYAGAVDADVDQIDIDILRTTWSSWLDPGQDPPCEPALRVKALINACKEHRYLPVFSKRTTLRREIYDRVASRWQDLGLSARAPSVRAYATDQPVVCPEEGNSERGKHNGSEPG